MKALILGATGATGKDLLQLVLADDDFTSIDIFVRRDLSIVHPKLTVHVVDFDKPDQWNHLVKGDALFSCLGTTLKAAGSKKDQWKVDYEYQFQFAKAARDNGVATYILVSADGASAKSLVFYSKMKGQLEEAVKALRFPKLCLFRPPILERKGSDRMGELIGVKAIKFLNKLGLLKAQKPLPTSVLAQALVQCAKRKGLGLFVIRAKEIWTLNPTQSQ